MDLRQLLHNKWAIGGVVVAAGAGLVVYLRKRGSSASSTAGGSASVAASPGYTSTAMGGFDSTGTDVASWLGSEQGFIDNQFTQFGSTLTQALAQIPTQSTTGAPSTPSTPTTTTTAPPPATPVATAGGGSAPVPKSPAATYVTVGHYGVDPISKTTLSGIASANKTTVSALLKLNPSITNPNLIFPNERIRVA